MSIQVKSWFANPQRTEPVLPPAPSEKITPAKVLPAEVQVTSKKIENTYSKVVSQLTCICAKIKEKIITLFSAAHIQLTDTKIKQIVLSTISCYSLIGARVIAGGLIPVTISSFAAATPLFAISGALLWYSISLVDYQNPATLDDIRNQSQRLPLPEIIKKHGWKNLFTFEILNPKAFSAAYCAHANTLSFNGIINLYKQASLQNNLARSPQSAPSFPIPAPSQWKKKFLEETKELSPEQIIKNYEISDLKSFEILTNDQIAILEKSKELNDRELEERKSFGKEIDTYLSKEHEKSLIELREAQHTLNTASKRERDVCLVRFPEYPCTQDDLKSYYTKAQIMGVMPNIGGEFNTILNDCHAKYIAAKESLQAEKTKLAKDYTQALTRDAPKKA